MQPREKILAGALGAFVAFWLVGPQFDKAFLQPLRDAQQKIDDARELRVVAEDAEVKIIQAKGRLTRWKAMSLPADPDVAMRVYQEWLTDLTEVSGWRNVKITPGRRATKGETFTTIPVQLEATITWEQLGRFATMFQQANLLQRFSRFDISSRNSGGTGPVDVILMAEALALNAGPKGNQIAPEATLAAALPVGQTELTVSSTKGFPEKSPFLLRIGPELTVVTANAGNRWTLQRGLWGTSPRSHDAGQQVQLLPVVPALLEVPLPPEVSPLLEIPVTLEKFKTSEFFAKPGLKRIYEPKFAAVTPPQAYFNQKWTMTIKVDGWDPEWDEPVYILRGDYPAEMQIDSSTGQIDWTPAPAAEPQQHEVELAVISIWESEPKVTQKFTLKSMRANLPPVLEIPATLPVFFGQPVKFTWLAQNPAGETDRLTYNLEGQLPTGATFNDRTGEFLWNPPLDGIPGEVSLTLTVTDDGTPPATTARDIRLTLADDAAMYTRLEGVFGVNDQRFAFFRDLTVNRQKKTQVGDRIQYANISGTVDEIGTDFVILSEGEERWLLKTGQNLRQRQALPPKPVPADVPTSTEDQPPAVPTPENIPPVNPPANATSFFRQLRNSNA